MPSATMREESEYKFPEDTPFPAILSSVTEKEIPYTIKNGPDAGKKSSFKKWVWAFDITEGEFAGLTAYGETEAKLTNHPDNHVRQWAEVLQDAPIGIGDGLNTDDLLGLPCVVTVAHGEPRPKTDGGKFYPCDVNNVFPEGTKAGQFGSDNAQDEPPF